MKATKDKLSFKVSLLSISLFLMMAPQISSVLPLMYDAFPNVSKAGVETLVTIPNFGIMVGLFISPFLIKFLGQKATILLGLVITLLTGTFPMYTSDYHLILASRFLIGAGIGLFNAMAVSLIPQFYQDDENERASMLGYQSVMGSLGAALSSFLVSYLATISWHAAFAIYFLVVPSLILFFLFVPLKDEVRENPTKPEKTEKQSISKKVLLIASIMFFLFMFYMPSSFKLPTLIVQENIGDSSTAALIVGISTLVGIPMGATFGAIFKRLHDKILPLGILLVVLGFLGVSFANNLPLLLLSVIVTGTGFGFAVPYMYNWLGWAAPQHSINLATTIVLIMVNIGCFISPTVMNIISSFFGSNSPRTVMLVSTAGFFLIFIYTLVHYFNVHRR